MSTNVKPLLLSEVNTAVRNAYLWLVRQNKAEAARTGNLPFDGNNILGFLMPNEPYFAFNVEEIVAIRAMIELGCDSVAPEEHGVLRKFYRDGRVVAVWNEVLGICREYLVKDCDIEIGTAQMFYAPDNPVHILLHPSSITKGAWQLTKYDANDEEPIGHMEFPTWKEAYDSAKGGFVRGNPPYGSVDYEARL